VDELQTNFEKWMYVLKNLKRLDNVPEKLQERIFERIFASAEIAKLTPDEYRDYIDSLNSYRDLKNSLDYAKAVFRKGDPVANTENYSLRQTPAAKKYSVIHPH